MQHAFCLSLLLFCTTTTLFCTTKTSNFFVSHYFYGGIVVCAYPIFCFLCSCPLLFFTAARSLSRLLLPLIFILLFFFLRDSSPLFSITRFSSFSVIHVSVNIKNNVEKDTTLLLFFFFLKVRATMWLRCISVAIPVDWIIWHWYACGADGRSGRQAVGVRSRDYQIFSDR